METCRVLIENGCTVNDAMVKGHTALHLAAQNGHTDTCVLIATHGGDVHAKDYWGLTPLHRAAHNNHKDTIEALLTYGSDVTTEDRFEFTVLQRAAQRGHRESMEILTSHTTVHMRRNTTAGHLTIQRVHFGQADSSCRVMGMYIISEESEDEKRETSRRRIRRERFQTMYCFLKDRFLLARLCFVYVRYIAR